ncbi:hypothetical protein DXC97_30960 [Lachnospiraceae bacterium TF09-5]|nr:hypothetical protein DXC97_30960 [Lachnospiraceae bacterium TF09-5]
MQYFRVFIEFFQNHKLSFGTNVPSPLLEIILLVRPIFCQGSRACPPFAPRLLPALFAFPSGYPSPGGYVYPAKAF